MPNVQYLAGWSSSSTKVVNVTSAVPASTVAYFAVISDNATMSGVTVSSVVGLGGTWTEVHNNTYFKVYRGVGCTGTGNITATFSGFATTVGGVWFVPDATANVISVAQANTATATITGPSQSASLGQQVLTLMVTYNSTTSWPSSSTPATGWSSTTVAPYAGIANRSPAGSAESHQLAATSSGGGSFSAIGQAVVGSAASVTPAVSATAAGAGVLVAAVVEVETASAGASGSGTLAATVVEVEKAAAAATGSGTTSAVVVPVGAVSAALSGSGTLAAAVEVVSAIPVVAASAAGAGTLAASVAAVEVRTAAAAGSGTLAAVATPVGLANAAATGSGTLSAVVVPVVPSAGVPVDLSTFVDLYASTSWDGTSLTGSPQIFTFADLVLDPATTYTVQIDYTHTGGEFGGSLQIQSIITPDEAGKDSSTSETLSSDEELFGSGTVTLTIGPGLAGWDVGVVGAGEHYIAFFNFNVAITGIRVDPAMDGEPGGPGTPAGTTNDAYKLTLGGWGVATWEPAVVLAPFLGVRRSVISAIAYGPVTMNGTRPVFTYSEADRPRLRQRVMLGGRDVTYDRGVPVPDVEYELADLLLYGPGTLELPQYVAFAETGTSVADRWSEGRRVKVQLVDDFTDPAQPAVLATTYKGFVLNTSISGRHLALELAGEAAGRLNLRDAKVLFRDVLDISRLLWRELTDVGVRYLPRLGEPGIGINSLNFGGMGKLEKVQELLARAIKKDGTQRAVLPDESGAYRTIDKDTTTAHFTVFVDDAFTVPELDSDLAEKPNTIYATAIAPSGRRIDGAAVPGLLTTPAPAYPMDDSSSFGEGTTNEDTDSGDGVSIMVNRLGAVGLLDIRDTPGGYDEDASDAVRKLQRKAGLFGTGTMTPATWRALWDLDVTGRSPSWSTIQPTAQDPSIQRYLRSAAGAPIGLNPAYDPDAIQVDESIDMGTGFRERQVDNWAETRVHAPGEKVWYGTLTLHLGAVLAGQVEVGDTITADDLVDARLVQPGRHNLYVPNFDGGTLFGVSGAQVRDDTVVFTVDTRHRPAREIWERRQVRRETRNDPARRWLGTRQSTQTKDAVRGFIGWGGIIDRDVPLERGWNVIEVVAGDYGTIGRIQTIVQTVTVDGGSISIDPQEYALAVFGKPVSAAKLNELVPHPLTISGTKMWQTKKPQLDRLGMLYSVGTHSEPCGYAPGRKHYESETGEEPNPAYDPDADGNESGTDDDETITVTTTEAFGTVTGLHEDDAGFPYAAENGMTLFLAVRVSRPTTLLKGRVMWPLLEGGV